MTNRVLGGGVIDGDLGVNPDWINLEIPDGRVVQAISSEDTIEYYRVGVVQKVGGHLLSNGLYANQVRLAVEAAVNTVNGATGDVVLEADDINLKDSTKSIEERLMELEALASNTSLVNETKEINSGEVLITNGTQEWLSSGNVIFDNLDTNYPEATRSFQGRTPGVSVSAQNSNPLFIAVDSQYVYVMSGNPNTVYRYDKTDDTFTALSFLANQGSSSANNGLSVDDTHVYTGERTTNTVRGYNKSTGAYDASKLIDTSGETTQIEGLSVTATHTYVSCSGTDAIYEYDNSTKLYTGNSWDAIANSQDITIDGDKILVLRLNRYVEAIDMASDTFYQVADLNQTTSSTTGISLYGDELYSVTSSGDIYAKSERCVGMRNKLVNNTLPVYTRIK